MMPYTRDRQLALFWSRVQLEQSCWIWTAGVNSGGYGRMLFQGRQWYTHRLAWFLLMGEEPAEVLDHLCRRRRCLNPDHLMPSTQRENLLRSPATLARQNVDKVRCPHNHVLDGRRTTGQRYCRTCQREYARMPLEPTMALAG